MIHLYFGQKKLVGSSTTPSSALEDRVEVADET
jgi:hypothetical protein